MKRLRSASPSPSAEEEEYIRPTYEAITKGWKVDWKGNQTIVKKLVDEATPLGMKRVMRFFEAMSDEDLNRPFIDMRQHLDGAGLSPDIEKTVKKRLRHLCRGLNFEETVKGGEGVTLFRAPVDLTETVCDAFELIECLFETVIGSTFDEYFSKSNPKKIKKRKTDSESGFELPDHLAVTGIDASGKPVFRHKTLLEMHQEGFDKANVDKANELMEKQQKMQNMWGDDARNHRRELERAEARPEGAGVDDKIDYDDGMDEWNESRFDRSVIEKGTGSTVSKQSAAEFVNKLGSGNRFTKGQVHTKFL